MFGFTISSQRSCQLYPCVQWHMPRAVVVSDVRVNTGLITYTAECASEDSGTEEKRISNREVLAFVITTDEVGATLDNQQA